MVSVDYGEWFEFQGGVEGSSDVALVKAVWDARKRLIDSNRDKYLYSIETTVEDYIHVGSDGVVFCGLRAKATAEED